MNSGHTLRIVIPACNEAERLEPTVRDYCTTFDGRAVILVVANGCSDETVAVVKRLKGDFSDLQLLEIPARIGKGGAVRAGFATAREPYVGFVDADGSTRAGEFARMHRALAESGDDALIGSRWLPGAVVTPRQKPLRRLASRCFNLMVRVILGLKLSDTQCGAKIFRRSSLHEVLASLELAGFAFDVEVLWRLKRAGYKVRETATVWSDTDGSKIRLVSASYVMAGALLRLRLRDSIAWRIPFVDLIGRSSTIPVKSQHRILLLGTTGRESNADGVLPQFLADLRRSGLTIVETRSASRSRISTLFWYVFASHRDYDAIVEVASDRPALIPAFSSKPTAVVHSAERFPSSAYAAFYSRSLLISLNRMAPAKAVELTVAAAKRSHYHFVFSDGVPIALTR